MSAGKKRISIVTPGFNEGDHVADCLRPSSRSATTPPRTAPGGIAAEDRHVKVIFNAPNFGPFCSTCNGLWSSAGDAVVVLVAADLQDPPGLIPEFVERWEQRAFEFRTAA
jgi:polyisoprenyl-phosphate glycosyltransferase